jgi:hypothetical protein
MSSKSVATKINTNTELWSEFEEFEKEYESRAEAVRAAIRHAAADDWRRTAAEDAAEVSSIAAIVAGLLALSGNPTTVPAVAFLLIALAAVAWRVRL